LKSRTWNLKSLIGTLALAALIVAVCGTAHCQVRRMGDGTGGNPIGSASNLLNIPVLLAPGSPTNGAPQGFVVVPGSGTLVITTNNATNLVFTVVGGAASNAQPPSVILTNLSLTGAITNANTNQFTVDNGIVTFKNGARVTNELNLGWLRVQAGFTNAGPFNHIDTAVAPYNNMRLFSETTPLTNVRRSVIIGDHLGIGAVDDGFMSGILTSGSSFTITNESGELMADSAFLGGGFHRIQAVMDSGILGGHTHSMYGAVESALLGGSHNVLNASDSVIAGGITNRIYGGSGVIAGGRENVITNSTHGVIIGTSNRITSGTNTLVIGNKVTNNTPNTTAIGEVDKTYLFTSTSVVASATQFRQGMAITPTYVTLTADDQVITVTSNLSSLSLSSDSVTAADRDFTLAGAPPDGSLLYLVWEDPTSAGRLQLDAGTTPVRLEADWTPVYLDNLVMRYSAAGEDWREIGRSYVGSISQGLSTFRNPTGNAYGADGAIQMARNSTNHSVGQLNYDLTNGRLGIAATVGASNVIVTNLIRNIPQTAAFAGTNVFIDGRLGNFWNLTLTNNVKLHATNIQAGATYIINMLQDGTGSRLLYPASLNIQTNASNPHVLSTAANAIDVLYWSADITGTNVNSILNANFAK